MQITDITKGNRKNLTDAKDPGGRLGPWQENGGPDLRNLKVYYAECLPNDLLILVSDGIHDNFDPQHLGKQPKDFPEIAEAETWEEAEKRFPEKSEFVKNTYRNKLVEDKIMEMVKQGTKEPKYIAAHLVDYCSAITSNVRTYMQENPTKRQPTDYLLYPGKVVSL
jgi:hypothetical protein